MIVNIKSPEKIIDNIKKELIIAVIDRKHGFHTPVFSNIKKHNQVASRVVVLRKFDPINMILNFHTDYRSPKVSNLKQNNKSMLVFYDHKLKIQMRIKTTSIINYQNEIAKEMWDKTKLLSRKCYLTSKDPSSLTTLPEDGIPEHLIGKEPEFEESEKGYKNFTVIENKINEIDWLYLEISGHRRLNLFFENNKPQFHWLIP